MGGEYIDKENRQVSLFSWNLLSDGRREIVNHVRALLPRTKGLDYFSLRAECNGKLLEVLSRSDVI